MLKKNIKYFINFYYFSFLLLSIFFFKFGPFTYLNYYLLILLGSVLYLLYIVFIKEIDILKINFISFLKYFGAFILSISIWSIILFLFLLFYYEYDELMSSLIFDSNTSIFFRRVLMILSLLTYTAIIKNSRYIEAAGKTLPDNFNISEIVYLFFCLLSVLFINISVYSYLFIFLILLFSMPDFLIILIYKTLLSWKEELKNNPKAVVILSLLAGILIALIIGENKAFAADKETKMSGLGDSSSSAPKKPGGVHPDDKKLLGQLKKKGPAAGNRFLQIIALGETLAQAADRVKNLPPGRPATSPSPGTERNPFSGTNN